jgi:uncharacterized phage protein gp47/JayE
MPWTTPTLKDVRRMTRDNVTALLKGAALIGNNVLRVMTDTMAGLARLVLEYIDWLSKQLLPDTAEAEWLDRHGQIWLVNSDGTKGRKGPTQAIGSVTCTGTSGADIPAGSLLALGDVQYETLAEVILDPAPTPVNIRALVGGSNGNQDEGAILNFVTAIPNVDGSATVVELNGGSDEESDDQLRARILLRIQQPPMGGDQTDYVQWALAVPGVTRAWCYPMEMGIGTVTVRFMCDQLRADNGGFPTQDDIDAVSAYLAKVRPVTVKNCFVEAPIPYPINVPISNLNRDDPATRGNITTSLLQQFLLRQMPGQTWYEAWSDQGIAGAAGVISYDLTTGDTVMPDNGHMPVLGNITYG